MLGETVVQQTVYKLASQAYANLRQEGFKTKEKLKDETVAEVKKMIQKSKTDWL